jgi:hypothetical protein
LPFQQLLQALQLWQSWHLSPALLLSQQPLHWPTPSQLMPRPSSNPSSSPISSVKERIMATTLMLTTTARSSTSVCQLKMMQAQSLKLLNGASSAATRPSLTRLLLHATMRLMLSLVQKLQPFMVLLSLERLMIKFSAPEIVNYLLSDLFLHLLFLNFSISEIKKKCSFYLSIFSLSFDIF